MFELKNSGLSGNILICSTRVHWSSHFSTRYHLPISYHGRDHRSLSIGNDRLYYPLTPSYRLYTRGSLVSFDLRSVPYRIGQNLRTIKSVEQ